MSEAFVTLATTDGYALGALVLGQSLKKVGTNKKLCVMITDHVSGLVRENLESTYDEVIVVNLLDSKDAAHLKLLERPELGVTFTKLHCWTLTQYQKCVFLDADCLVLQSVDDLFEREELSAAPDAGWPDIFNSGVFVFKPSKDTFQKLVTFASEQGSFDGGDQGLLNKFFSSWPRSDISRHLPFTYNVTSNTFYSYVPAINQFRSDIRIVHFAGTLKPWQLTYDPQIRQLSGCYQSHERDFLLKWWALIALTQGIESGSAAHRRAWEAGYVDYGGRDSYSKIQEQLDKNIAMTPQTHERPLSASNGQRQQKHASRPNNNEQQQQATTGLLPQNEDERQIPADVTKTQQEQLDAQVKTAHASTTSLTTSTQRKTSSGKELTIVQEKTEANSSHRKPSGSDDVSSTTSQQRKTSTNSGDQQQGNAANHGISLPVPYPQRKLSVTSDEQKPPRKTSNGGSIIAGATESLSKSSLASGTEATAVRSKIQQVNDGIATPVVSVAPSETTIHTTTTSQTSITTTATHGGKHLTQNVKETIPTTVTTTTIANA
ncbi:unnamed protein product, partial [Didymodactylos carnosus]